MKTELARDPLAEDLFLFVSRTRKGLFWDSTGLCLFAKRLERGRVSFLWLKDASVVRLTASELALFVEGCEIVGRRALSPEVVVRRRPEH